MYKRIILKLSGETLAPEKVSDLAAEVAEQIGKK